MEGIKLLNSNIVQGCIAKRAEGIIQEPIATLK
jgi:hypothetical protein